jgi:glucosamine 6-phosphate synthetase-like amidotransferase/phosphosugar isomerase protein
MQRFLELGELNSKRGGRGFGLVAGNRTSTLSFQRGTGNFASREYDVDLPIGVDFYLGHTLAPTNGDDVTLERTHPFETDRFLLAHNGILHNSDDLFAEWGFFENLPDIDSVAILAGIVHFIAEGDSVVDAIVTTASACQGQFACWLYDKQDGGIYLWRVMSPIHVEIYRKHTPKMLLFSSEPTEKSVLIPQGEVFSVTQAAVLTPVRKFTFYDPYYRGEHHA